MAVAYDASSKAAASTTSPLSWTHTPVGTPGHVWVGIVVDTETADGIGAVTYGGVAMTPVSDGFAVESVGAETGYVKLYELTTGIPTGAQTVSAAFTGSEDHAGVCVTSTTGAAAEVYASGIVALEGADTLAEASVSDGSTGVDSTRYGIGFSGLNTPPAAGANSTVIQSEDFGLTGLTAVRENTAGQGSRSVGWSSGSSDERAMLLFAVREVVPDELDTSITLAPVTLLAAAESATGAELSEFTAPITLASAAVAELVSDAEITAAAISLAATANVLISAGLEQTVAAKTLTAHFNPPRELDLDQPLAGVTLAATASTRWGGALLRVRLIASRLM